MRQLRAIQATYDQINSVLEQQKSKAHGKQKERLEAKIDERMKINNQAYFVLAWGQFETAVNEKCADAIKRRREDNKWSVRRGWDIYNPNDRRLSGLSFQDRVALVCDKKGRTYKRALHHYNNRNVIAHGNLEADIDISSVFVELFALQGQLND